MILTKIFTEIPFKIQQYSKGVIDSITVKGTCEVVTVPSLKLGGHFYKHQSYKLKKKE